MRHRSHRTDCPGVNSPLIEESVMGNIAWLVPGFSMAAHKAAHR
jgi:hypothetical protein